MNSIIRQLGIRCVVALATLGLVVPTIGSAPCACGTKLAAAEKAMPPCCAKRSDSTCSDIPVAMSDNCCSGTAPCDCPGCNCSVQAPVAVTVGAVILPTDSSDQFLSFALAADWRADFTASFSRAALAEQSLLRTPPLSLRALYCVWVI